MQWLFLYPTRIANLHTVYCTPVQCRGGPSFLCNGELVKRDISHSSIKWIKVSNLNLDSSVLVRRTLFSFENLIEI